MDTRRIDLLYRYERTLTGPIEEAWVTVHDYGELVAMFSVPIGPFDGHDDVLTEAHRRCQEIPFQPRLTLD